MQGLSCQTLSKILLGCNHRHFQAGQTQIMNGPTKVSQQVENCAGPMPQAASFLYSNQLEKGSSSPDSQTDAKYYKMELQSMLLEAQLCSRSLLIYYKQTPATHELLCYMEWLLGLTAADILYWSVKVDYSQTRSLLSSALMMV